MEISDQTSQKVRVGIIEGFHVIGEKTRFQKSQSIRTFQVIYVQIVEQIMMDTIFYQLILNIYFFHFSE